MKPLNVNVTIDERYIVFETDSYFITGSVSNIFNIYQFNSVNSVLNINKHISSHTNIVSAMKELYRLAQRKS